ncbi:hypothetical protein [Nostoc sp. CMAA1605]|uniref:hypothetical protein n=1 Tax=Nostoc sp. CMAA1605 TaxID=2055159 RepID=UPI001F2C68E5|nr:hypothetical protein [Nostoc sp. CMAA1605]MCF4967917.1 hypothetical protein [Nostoc sp. CMAA1605]
MGTGDWGLGTGYEIFLPLCSPTPLHPYTPTPLYPYTLTPLHPYTPKFLPPKHNLIPASIA